VTFVELTRHQEQSSFEGAIKTDLKNLIADLNKDFMANVTVSLYALSNFIKPRFAFSYSKTNRATLRGYN
jgi:hypothetical protein